MKSMFNMIEATSLLKHILLPLIDFMANEDFFRCKRANAYHRIVGSGIDLSLAPPGDSISYGKRLQRDVLFEALSILL